MVRLSLNLAVIDQLSSGNEPVKLLQDKKFNLNKIIVYMPPTSIRRNRHHIDI